MNFRLRIPQFVSSSVESGRQSSSAVLDGRDVTVPNVWNLEPGVYLCGRPAVWITFAFGWPAFGPGRLRVPPWNFRFESDFGGHLFLAIVRPGETGHAYVIEAGPTEDTGTGALVPYRYPEDDFARRGVVDFAPRRVRAPHGMREDTFASLLVATQRAYDGNQYYLVIELPFLRVGRDSNSYAVGVLLACGIDARAIPKSPSPTLLRRELTGYPGAEDPVHRANFGIYSGAANRLGDGALEIATHEANGDVRYVTVGGAPDSRVYLADGHMLQLDGRGRVVLEPDEARAHGLPTQHTDPPAQIVRRERFPKKPAPAGAEITLVVDGTSMPLVPGDSYCGKIVGRNDALGVAFLDTDAGQRVLLPLTELRVELRDPARVDRLLQNGTRLTVGLHRDRHPMLVAEGEAAADDAMRWHRFHAPSWTKVALASALGLALAGVAGTLWLRSRAD